MPIRYLSGVTVDSNTLVVDAANDRVGIGTTAPQRLFHINSASSAGEALVAGAFGANLYFRPNTSYSAGGNFGIFTTGLTSGTFESTMTIKGFSSAVTDVMTIKGSGNVGIGTTAPYQSKLHVTKSEAGATPMAVLRIGNQGAGYTSRIILTDETTNDANISYLGATQSLGFGLGTSLSQMVLTSAGNVGIGTASPVTTLQVNATSPAIRLQETGSGGDKRLELSVNSSGVATIAANQSAQVLTFETVGSERMRIASTGATRLNAYGSGSFTGTVAYNLAVDSSGNVIETAGGVVDGSGTANYVSKWSDANTLTDSQLFDNGTNVGIGTSSPANTLQIGSVGATGYSGNRLAVGDGTNVVALHPGAVSYLTANGDIVIGAGGNTTNQVYVKSGGNVGIGTTNPAGKLHIADDGPNALIIGDTQVSTIGETNNGGYPGMKIVPYNSNIHIGISSTTDNKINLWYGGQNYTYWQQLETYSVISNYSTSALVLQVNGGNVGIGTTSPSFRFDVAGAAGDWATRFTSNAGASAYFAHGGGYGGYIDAGSNASSATYLLSLVSNGSTRVYVRGDGNVGIGTGAPSLASSGIGLNIVNDSYTQLRVQSSASSAGIEFKPSSGDEWEVQANTSSNWFVYNRTDESYRLLINGSGNVGIGTTSPAAKLDVAGDIRLGGTATYNSVSVYNNGASGGGGYLAYQNGVANAYFGAAGWYIGNSDTGAVIGTDSSSRPIRFYTNTERMRITGAGLVGIGTTAPYSNLEITSTDISWGEGITINPAPAGYSATFYRVQGTSGSSYTGTWAIGKNSSSDAGGESFQIVKNGLTGSTAYRVDAVQQWKTNGDSIFGYNVGIGTTSPSSLLDVYNGSGWGAVDIDGTSGGEIRLQKNGTTYGNLYASDNSSTAFVINAAQVTDLILQTNSSERLRITAAGNVGIGTTAPTSKLYIEGGSANWNETTPGLSVGTIHLDPGTDTNDYGNAITFGASDAGGGTNAQAGIYLRSDGNYGTKMYFATTDSYDAGSKTRMFIGHDGNVGIGTTSPANKLVAVADATFNGENSYAIAAVSSTDVAYKTIVGYDYANDVGVISAVRTGIEWKNLSILPVGNTNLGVGTLSPSQRLHVSGNIRVTGAYYDSSNSAGSSGQVLSSTGSGTDWVSLSEISGVDGTGTANYVAKWSDADTIANSQIVDNGTNVGINNVSPKTKLDVNGTIGFGSKSMSMTDTFAAALTINMFDHHGCYVKLTAFGDWANHSTIAYLGEFFIQASAGAYNEPGIIIRQVDNTGGGDDIQAQILDPAGAGTRDFIIELKATSASNTPFTAHIQYEVRGLYNSVS